MKRAIVVYLEGKRELLLQFGCLYTSYRSIQSKDTDLVIFGPKQTLELLPDDCIKIEYDSPYHDYPYLNSISCIASSESDSILKDYEYILRTDADTFLTPAWNSFYPEYFTAGIGKYAFDSEVQSKLMELSRLFGLNHRGIHNIGTSHYGKTKQIKKVCELSLLISECILAAEFYESEGSWPGWYRGVTSMYSSEIAINHLIDHLLIEPDKLDFDSTSDDRIESHPHIHCWHTDEAFSKFQFADGNYNHLSLENLDPSIIKDYCMFISLKALIELDVMKRVF
ncbi:hypothetical protein DFO70_11361 [Cytobacillus firmus]|uniref:DUF7164 domain-containing protein n=2 Tax=Cytobacillus TaxID=2675230 RepID=A0A366JLZ9_CYTFI|nr:MULTISPECIES: hypothetical protein [Cytobacillus]RBP88737.1 hypothetical protein DFO70_11361 [Cytobacillus firmus]TDX39522.1 hypothetical protein DFO72_110119 [Cytobacillus oceanisediminis]